MSEPPPPLPPDVARLLDAERRRPAEQAERIAAITQAARVRLAAVPGGGGGGGGGAPSAGSGARAAALAKILGPFLVGALVGSGITAVVTRPAPMPPAPPAQTQPAPAPLAPTPTPLVTPLPAPASEPTPVEALDPDPSPPVARETSELPLAGDDHAAAAERRLVETARAALLRGDSAAALRALDLHAQRFPDGSFSEECSALRVRALVAAGRTDEAHTALDELDAQYPTSIHRTALRALVARAEGEAR